MNGDDAKKIINRHTGVSIGIGVIVIGAVWFMATSDASLEARVDNINGDYMPRGELNQRLLNIEGDVLETKNAVAEIRNYLIK